MRTMRTVALILLACVLASLGTVAVLMMTLGAAGGLLVAAAIAGAVFLVYVEAIGPWQRRWGATDVEVGRVMPGDDVLGPGAATTTRAITIDAPPGDVFPWLLQIGYGRGGWYSYDWIDNDGEPSADRIDPALQRLEVGDRIEMLPGFGPIVREVVANRHIVSAGETDSWCLQVEEMDGGTTRLISRWRQRWPRGVATRLWIAVVDPGAFIMERKMLRTICDRAAGLARSRAGTPAPA
jgi:hypothetical protein